MEFDEKAFRSGVCTDVRGHERLRGAQLGSNRPSPEQSIFVVWACVFLIEI
jgi:hypothetical protein